MQHPNLIMPTLANLSEQEAAQLSMSICIYTDGLTFSIGDQSGSELYNHVLETTPSQDTTTANGLADLLYSLPWATYPYESIQIRFGANFFQLQPAGFNHPLLQHRWLNSATTQEGHTPELVTSIPIGTKGIHLLAAWDKELWHFLGRTYLAAKMRPYIADIAEKTLNQSTQWDGLNVAISVGQESADFFIAQQGIPKLGNRYTLPKHQAGNELSEEVLYLLAAALTSIDFQTSAHPYAVELYLLGTSPQMKENMHKRLLHFITQVTANGGKVSLGTIC